MSLETGQSSPQCTKAEKEETLMEKELLVAQPEAHLGAKNPEAQEVQLQALKPLGMQRDLRAPVAADAAEMLLEAKPEDSLEAEAEVDTRAMTLETFQIQVTCL